MKEMVGGCCVCSDERGWKENPLVYCDGHGCNVAVHQACYGIISVPSGPWYCRKCESQERAARVRCELCPEKDGALKRTDSGGWCHVICALYIPEACFQNVETMEPIVLKSVPHDRFSKVCYICEERKKDATKNYSGACMQCNKAGCRQFFHVTCGQSEGLLCEVSGTRGDNVKYIAYCSYHFKRVRKDGNVKTIPAFIPIPADNTTPETASEKHENGTYRLSKERKTASRSSSIGSEPSPALSEAVGDQEVLQTTKGEVKGEPFHTTASQETPSAKTMASTRTRRHIFAKPENYTTECFPISSAGHSQPSFATAGTSSENLFTAQCDTLLSSGRSGGIFGSVAASGLAHQSVIVTNEQGSSSNDGKQSSANGFVGQGSLLLAASSSLGSTSETTKGKQPCAKSQARRGKRGRKAAQPAAQRKRKTLSSDQLAGAVSASGHPMAGGTVFGGSPCFQSPISLSSFSAPDGETSNRTSPFALPLPPNSIPSQLSHELDPENGKTPRSLIEFLEHQWDDTARFLMEHSNEFDVAVVLGQLNELRTENRQLEEQVKALMAHRDHLMSAISQLSIPYTTTPQRLPEPCPAQLPVAADSNLTYMEVDTSAVGAQPMPTRPISEPAHLPVRLTTPSGSQLDTIRPTASPLSLGMPESVKQCPSFGTTSTLQDSQDQLSVLSIADTPLLRIALNNFSGTSDSAADKT
ncbi:uncharacterized protein LOC143301490 [Babylonia areolata]|uniref:uncharacterized protein LOC143301490 n=1 Tax=Babylonia areolata TaxID=304850 RepID=UPI003FD384A7